MPVIFRPWIGEQYFSQSPKILVLGESHYLNQNERDIENFTIRVVRDLRLPGNKKIRFFTIVAMIVSGKPYNPLSDDASNDFWNKVAFYNFIQFPVGDSARLRPTENMWRDSFEPFKLILNELDPDLVLVLGKELENNIRALDKKTRPVFCYWYHPSSPKYFKKQQAIDSFQQVMDLWNQNTKKLM